MTLIPFVFLDIFVIVLCFLFFKMYQNEKLLFWKILFVISLITFIILILPQVIYFFLR